MFSRGFLLTGLSSFLWILIKRSQNLNDWWLESGLIYATIFFRRGLQENIQGFIAATKTYILIKRLRQGRRRYVVYVFHQHNFQNRRKPNK